MDTRSISQRLADSIASMAGSMPFAYFHIVWFSLWILLKEEPFPYGLLTMMVSLEAIFLSIFIMISSNSASERDRSAAVHDYKVNEDTKEELETLMVKIENMETNKLDHIISLLTRDK